MTNSCERPVLASAGYHADGVVELFRLQEDLEAKARALMANRGGLGAVGSVPDGGPAVASLRTEIRRIGERIHALGGTGAMVDIWDDLDRRVGHLASTAVDHAWHGVGRWAA